MKQYEVIHYEENGQDIFKDCVKTIKDKRGQLAILNRTDRMEEGNF